MSSFDESFSSDVSNTNSKKKSGKSKANGFLMFLLEYRRIQKSKGNFLEMPEAQEEAGKIWAVSINDLICDFLISPKPRGVHTFLSEFL